MCGGHDVIKYLYFQCRLRDKIQGLQHKTHELQILSDSVPCNLHVKFTPMGVFLMASNDFVPVQLLNQLPVMNGFIFI